jgi:hypothetical protein
MPQIMGPETLIQDGYRVTNALGVVVATFNTPDLAWGFIADAKGRRGPLEVQAFELIERRRVIRRLRRVA